jgi:hypothetical protein
MSMAKASLVEARMAKTFAAKISRMANTMALPRV